MPFVRMKDLGRYHFTNCLDQTDDKVTETAIVSCRLKIFDPGCILFPRSGSVALNHRAILGVRAAIVSHIGVLTNLRPEITMGYLFRYLTTFDMTALSKKTTGVDSIAFADVKRIPIPVPPLAEQERIVRLLDEADELRKLRAQADRRTSALIPALFHEMFGDPLRNTASLPTAALGRKCDVVRGASPRPIDKFLDGTVPWIRIADGSGSRYYIESTTDFVTIEGARRSVRVEPGSLVIANSGVSCGFARILKITGCIHDGWLAIRNLSPDLEVRYLLTLINQVTLDLRARAPSGTQPNLNTTLVKSLVIPVPPREMQLRFVDHLANIEALESAQSASRRRLDDLFRSMLHRAFNGEL